MRIGLDDDNIVPGAQVNNNANRCETSRAWEVALADCVELDQGDFTRTGKATTKNGHDHLILQRLDRVFCSLQSREFTALEYETHATCMVTKIEDTACSNHTLVGFRLKARSWTKK